MAINNILFSGWWWYGLQCIDTLRHDVGTAPWAEWLEIEGGAISSLVQSDCGFRWRRSSAHATPGGRSGRAALRRGRRASPVIATSTGGGRVAGASASIGRKSISVPSSPVRRCELNRWAKKFGSSPSWTTISDTSTTGSAGWSPLRTLSQQKCYPCRRNNP
jgi:hypothetical protein